MENGNNVKLILGLTLGAVLSIGGVCFTLVLDRMDKQEVKAAADLMALRAEIAATKGDAKDAVAATALAMKDAVYASSVSLTDKINLIQDRVEKLEDRSYWAKNDGKEVK